MPSFPPPGKAPFNPDPVQEFVRACVTLLMICIFLGVITFYMFQATKLQGEPWHQVEGAVREIFPAVTSVLGTALGFYFGSQKR